MTDPKPEPKPIENDEVVEPTVTTTTTTTTTNEDDPAVEPETPTTGDDA